MSEFQIAVQGGEDSAERRELLERVESGLQSAKLDNVTATLAVVGVESLHIIRDLYGSDLTHDILRTVASLFENTERKGATLGWIEDSRIVIFLADCNLERATALCDEVISRVRDVEMRAGKHKLNLAPNIGLAHTKHQLDYSLETLLQVASEGSEIASSGGGGCTVHTELYELVQPKAKPCKRRPKVVAPPPEPAPASPKSSSTTAASVVPEAKPAVPSAKPSIAPDESSEVSAASVPIESRGVEALSSNLAAGRVHDSMLEHMLREMFLLYEGRGQASGELREQVIGAVRRWSEESRSTLGKELHEQQETELELLRRRLAKMRERAEATEQELQALREGTHEEVGIESAFRVVQGLSLEDADYKLKSGMMQQILQANLDLMRQIH